jgi:hypothetical protein
VSGLAEWESEVEGGGGEEGGVAGDGGIGVYSFYGDGAWRYVVFAVGDGVLQGIDLVIDFTAANILLQLANIDEWTVDQIHERLGKPQTQDLHRRPGAEDDLSGPRYTISTINMVSKLATAFLNLDTASTELNQNFIDIWCFSEASGPSMALGSDNNHRLWHCLFARAIVN